jgi:hypothetical protein
MDRRWRQAVGADGPQHLRREPIDMLGEALLEDVPERTLGAELGQCPRAERMKPLD